MWTRPSDWACDQEPEELILRPPQEVKVELNLRGVCGRGVPGLMESVSQDQVVSTKDQEQNRCT